MAQPQPVPTPCRARAGWGQGMDAEAAARVGECLALRRLLEPSAAPPFSPEQRGFGTAPEPKAAAAGCIRCSALAQLPASLTLPAYGKGTVVWGRGVGGEGQGRGQLNLELHMPCSTAFGLALPPLPAWQPGSAWTHASRKQMPFQPLAGAVGWEGGGAGVGGLWGCAGEEDSPKPTPWGRRGLLHPCCNRSQGRVEEQPWPWWG